MKNYLKLLLTVLSISFLVIGCETKKSDPVPAKKPTASTSTVSGVSAAASANNKTSTAKQKLSAVKPPVAINTVPANKSNIRTRSGATTTNKTIKSVSQQSSPNSRRLTGGKKSFGKTDSASYQMFIFQNFYTYDSIKTVFKKAPDLNAILILNESFEYQTLAFTDSTYGKMSSLEMGEWSADEEGTSFAFTSMFNFIIDASGNPLLDANGMPTGAGSYNGLNADFTVNEAKAIENTSYKFVDFSRFDTEKIIMVFGLINGVPYYVEALSVSE